MPEFTNDTDTTVIALDEHLYEVVTEKMREDWTIFFRNYVIAMVWANATYDTESGEAEDNYPSTGEIELTEEDLTDLADDAQAFFHGLSHIFPIKNDAGQPYTWSDAGHDFALTRNGHGTGFWDRGLGAAGDQLTKIVEAYGSKYISVWKEDGEIKICVE